MQTCVLYHLTVAIFNIFSSPIVDTSGYFIPKDYPKQLGLDKELKLTGTQEPYVMAEYNKKDDLHFFGNVSEV